MKTFLCCPRAGLAATMMLLVAGTACSQTAREPYAASRQVNGVVRTWGSPQMGDLLRHYEASFSKLQPGVRFQNELHSTLTAVAGVYTGRAEIGVLGRDIWPIEKQAFASVEEHQPTLIDIATGAFDVPRATFALMVFVHQSNPLASLTTAQLESLFGSMAEGKQAQRWGDVGLTGEWAARPVHLYGFQTENDKALVFRDLVFTQTSRWNCNLREFGNTATTDAGERIVAAVASDPEGIGISNIHYATSGVRALAIGASGQAIAPTRQNVAARTYPLGRSVYFVVERSPEHPLPAAVAEFLKYVLSRQGSEDVVGQGDYSPLPAALAATELANMELATTPTVRKKVE